MSAMNRRRFLGLSGGVAATGLLGGLSLPGVAGARQLPTASTTNRTLVVVDLQGGNDALNTLVPQSGLYRDLRPTIGVDEGDLLSFKGLSHGVHPSLASLQNLWDSGQMTALYGIGMQGQGRSHFVAQDAWRTARPGEPARSGWLGRWLEASAAVDPLPLRAISLGQSTLAVQGVQGRPVAIQSVGGFRLKPPRLNSGVTAAVLSMGSPLEAGLMGQAQAAIPQTVEAVTQLQQLVAGIEINEGEEVDLDGDRALFHAAQAIIQGDVGTQVIYVTINGFDTHSLQGPKQDALLRLVGDGLAGMFAALETTGHADTTLALVVSEFGRRGAENGSGGTDHGQGGLSLLLGPDVEQSTVIGEPDLGDLVDGDLRIMIDARSMYDNALRWLGASDSMVVDVLGGEWNDLELLRAL
jgi:uncharacterized protein (DUF1501 family)